ncbi:hypothetical protein N802_08650 [Knoellia sinensis KCTC 19936]|uniref:Lipoprotein n=1 Tax=Knoellia sinensis KCTC 19936 TaxID=1385520 RepID=A0A0A0JB14_9MICO|nr:hypothetical protein [Knoellia sinensis]KGN33974.1 hypothetical protein N802_08650 [Knoellia sinensis KCTC 19936]
MTSMLLMALVGLLVSCGVPGAADPRAYPDSQTGITLDEALRLNHVALPADASDVRYSADANREVSLDLTFVTGCQDIPDFLRSAGVTEKLGSTELSPAALMWGLAGERDWAVDGDTPFLSQELSDDSRYRELAVTETASGQCRVFYVTGTV